MADGARALVGRSLLLLILAAAALMVPPELQAQRSLPDFLFKTPTGTLGFRAGFASPRASSEVWSFSRDQLTLGSSAMNGMHWGVQLGLRATDRLEVAIDLSSSRAETTSEFRHWVDTNDLPIEQNTFLSRVPFTVSLKAYLADRGQSVSRFAWVPAPLTPYVGAGAGMLWYVFEQHGDWVDFETLDIFTDTFRSDGKTPTAHVLAGFDVSLGPRFLFNTEGRYLWASAPMDELDFDGFDDIDLSGFQVTAGIAVRF